MANGATIHKGADARNINLVFVGWGGLGTGGTTSATHKEQELPNVNPIFARWASCEQVTQPAPSTKEQGTCDMN